MYRLSTVSPDRKQPALRATFSPKRVENAVALCLCLVACSPKVSFGQSTAHAFSGMVSITDFGAMSDGVTDNAPSFQKAWASGAKTVIVPAGNFAVSQIIVPDGGNLLGQGNASVLIPTSTPLSPLVRVGNDVKVSDLKLNGNDAKVVALRSGKVKNVVVRDVTIENFTSMAIETDRTEDMLIEGCTFRKAQRATNIQFSRRIKVLNNTATDCTQHGFQFWGNWKWERQDTSDLQFIGNYTRDCGGAGIWGTGGQRIVMASNIVDGARDVGLDLEWCSDSVITGNTVRRSRNAGISLFFACERVSITGNTVLNDLPISEKDKTAKWWVRSGIWLTYPNRKEFPKDFGHRDISILGNVITCTDGQRRAMWIGKESDNITLVGNTIRGGLIWSGGEQGGVDQPTKSISGDTTLKVAASNKK